jgi:predicted nucleotidyltransferase
MITKKQISKIVSDIVRKCSPEKIILFGSHAYGTPTDDSDVDLFIVANMVEVGAERIRVVLRAIEGNVPVDVVVRTPVEVERSLKGRDWFVQEIVQKGKVLYAR